MEEVRLWRPYVVTYDLLVLGPPMVMMVATVVVVRLGLPLAMVVVAVVMVGLLGVNPELQLYLELLP